MKKCWLVGLGLFVVTNVADAQGSQQPAESAYVELLGNTGSYSVNVDVVLPSDVGFRLGMMSASQNTFSRQWGYATEPVGVAFIMMTHVLLGRGPHHLEVGMGLVAGTWRHPALPPSRNGPAVTATLGYRYQQVPEGWLVRAGFTPAWAGDDVRPALGLSIGYSFSALFR